MHKPLVSVIMPCYNAAKFVKEAIESVLKQSYDNFELIIVNDGSNDGSEQIILSISDSRIVYIKQANLGQCSACNNGFKLAKGSLIKFFDADDILSEKVLEKQVEAVQDNPDCVAYILWARFYNNDVTKRDRGPTQIQRNCLPLEYLTWQRNTPMLQCGIWLFPRKLLIEHGLWDERLSLINDTEFITRILLHAQELKIADSCELLYRTNYNSGSLSQTLSKTALDSALLSIDLMANHLLEIENSERVKILIVQSYQMLREWAFPRHMHFVKLIEIRLLDYSGIKIHYRESGYIFNFTQVIFGWKVARFLQYYYYRIRFK